MFKNIQILEMFRVLLCRVIICSWAIPAQYLIMLPFFYLCFGDFKRELHDMNKMNIDLWNGKL